MPDSPSAASTAAAAAMESGKHCPPRITHDSGDFLVLHGKFGEANKGAGSEASLPVTLRVRRRASKLLFPQDSVKNLKKAASLLWKAALFVYVDLHFSGIDLYCGKPSPSAMADTFR